MSDSRAPGRSDFEGLAKARQGDGDGLPHHLDLVGRLDHPKRGEEPRSRDRRPSGTRAQETLDVVVGRRGLDGEPAGARREDRRRLGPGILGLFPRDHLRHGRHAPQPRLFEGRADDDGIGVREEKQGRQTFAAVEVDACQVVEVRGRRGVESVGRNRPQTLADGLEAPEIDFAGSRHGADASRVEEGSADRRGGSGRVSRCSRFSGSRPAAKTTASSSAARRW